LAELDVMVHDYESGAFVHWDGRVFENRDRLSMPVGYKPGECVREE
jgi:hypothetical protein